MNVKKHVKVRYLAFAIFLAAAFGVHAQSGGTKGMDMKDMHAHDMKEMKSEKPAPVHKASGTVRSIDSANGKLSISHGAVKTLNWPAMTMNFAVKDKAILDKLKPGEKVEFTFVQSGKDYLVTAIKPQ